MPLRALRGFVTTSDEAEELRAALEASAAERVTTDADALRILTLEGGNVSRAADALGVARSTIRARAKRARGG